MAKIIGRKSELEILKQTHVNTSSDLLVLYGRRRVGKTFLIREFYKNEMVFELTGLFNGGLYDQLKNFTHELSLRDKKHTAAVPENWFDAFILLERYLTRLTSKKKKVMFIDEFPWIASAKSKFLMAFEHFWNSFCTKRSDLIVVICGSAASYMVQKILHNKGGLHNRITQKIQLLPFDLHDADLFIKHRGIYYTKYDVLQVYMAMGGIPHYLNKLQKGKSVAQNIDALCFEKDGVLRSEFDELYASLFDDSDKHLKIIQVLDQCNQGLTRDHLIKKTKLKSGGDFTLKLNELIYAGFVMEHVYYQNKKKYSMYRLSDEYSKFYLKFIHNHKNNGVGTWQRLHQSRSYTSWSGFAFEALCLKHIHQIKLALRIDSIYSATSSWFNDRAQIDLLIDRDDKVINLCEIKFHNTTFTIDKNDYLNLKNKVFEFQKETGTRKNIFITLITTYGVAENKYSQELIQNVVDIERLFL
jgi:AAA+ ATPase superfamily predicted ATPase